MSPLLNLAAVAEMHDCGRGTVWRAVRSGALRAEPILDADRKASSWAVRESVASKWRPKTVGRPRVKR